MTAARLITIGPATLDDGAGRLVARVLSADGVPVASREIVDEDAGAIEAALGAAVATPGLVVVLDSPGGSGGEIVRRVLARLSGGRLALSDKFLALLEEDFSRRGQAMPRRLDRLGLLPQGAVAWPAADGAPGWTMEVAGVAVAVLPLGSPSLGSLVEERLRPLARQRLGGQVSLVRTLLTTGVPAADAEERLGAWLGKEGPVAVSTAIVDGDVWVRLSARGVSRPAAEVELGAVERAVREALGDDCYGRDGEALEAVVGALLVDRGLTVSVAESCTGGLLGHRLTGIAGSSRYFDRGVIVYSNQAKEDLLGVPGDLLRAHGAVSAPVAEAMASGICRVSGSPCGLAVTGIAGPDGGTPAKPVGTVFIGCAAPRVAGAAPAVEVRRFRFPGGRDAVKSQSAQSALDMLRRALMRAPFAPG
jgi:nicotinamide-nucleotide amidase